MRSRYSAFVRKLEPYLLTTWHASTRPLTLALEDEPGLRWLGLEVKRHAVISEVRAQVEFVARSKVAGRAYRLHEISDFVCEDGRWYYLSGEIKS